MTWLIVPALWLLICWWAPVVAIILTSPLSLSVALPDAFDGALKHNALLLVGTDMPDHLGFSVRVWPINVIVISKDVVESKIDGLLPFVVYHEIGHVALKHTRWRWWAVLLGIWWLPSVRRRYQRQEDEANLYAERVTGFSRAMLNG